MQSPAVDGDFGALVQVANMGVLYGAPKRTFSSNDLSWIYLVPIGTFSRHTVFEIWTIRIPRKRRSQFLDFSDNVRRSEASPSII